MCCPSLCHEKNPITRASVLLAFPATGFVPSLRLTGPEPRLVAYFRSLGLPRGPRGNPLPHLLLRIVGEPFGAGGAPGPVYLSKYNRVVNPHSMYHQRGSRSITSTRGLDGDSATVHRPAASRRS